MQDRYLSATLFTVKFKNTLSCLGGSTQIGGEILDTYISAVFLGGLRVTNPPIRLMCPTSVCPSTFSFLDSNSKTLCPIEFKLDRDIDHHHS